MRRRWVRLRCHAILGKGETETTGNIGFCGSFRLEENSTRNEPCFFLWAQPREAWASRGCCSPSKSARCRWNRPVLGAIRPISSFRPFPFPLWGLDARPSLQGASVSVVASRDLTPDLTPPMAGGLTRQPPNQFRHLFAPPPADRDTCTVPQDQHGFSRSGRPDLAHAVQPNDR